MTTTFNVTAAYDQPSYVEGETMTLRITGDATETTVETRTLEAFMLNIVGASSADVIEVPTVQVQTMMTRRSGVRIKAEVIGSFGAAFLDPSGRRWTVAADGQSATATA